MTYGFWGGYSGGWGGYSGGRSFGRFGWNGRSSQWGKSSRWGRGGGWNQGGWGKGGWGKGGWGKGGWGKGGGCGSDTICIEESIEDVLDSLDLPETVTFTITGGASPEAQAPGFSDSGEPSYFDINIAGDNEYLSGDFEAYCIFGPLSIGPVPYEASVYSSIDAFENGLVGTSAEGLIDTNGLDNVNWLINQEELAPTTDGPYSVGDFQKAIWTLLGDDTEPVTSFDQGRVDELVALAQSQGDGYIPEDKLAVILVPEAITGGGSADTDGDGITNRQPIIAIIDIPEPEKKCYDKVTGSCWDDCLYGDDGNDFIDGKGGDDYMKGGEGCDIFYFKKGESLRYCDNVTVKDFNTAEDTLMFKGYGSGVSSLSDLGSISQYSGGLKIDLSGYGGTLKLQNLTMADVANIEVSFA